MKACVLHKPGPVRDRPLRFEDVRTPDPPAGHLLIRVSACAVCRTDLHVVEGDLPVRHTPLIPGHQVVGTVEATGERFEPEVPKLLHRRRTRQWLNTTSYRAR